MEKTRVTNEPNANQKEFIILTVCKNVVEKFVTIILLFKKSIILLRGQSVIL